MREIKFRAKRLDNGEWVKGDLAHSLDGGLNIFGFTRENGVDGYSGVHLIDPKTVCQFTGLKDSEGKEVWEGDILEGESKYEIVYTKGAFATVCIGYDERVYSYPLCYYVKEDGAVEGKVIGNKFDKYLSEAKKVLTLTVSKEWFDMIVSGEKTEEYREIKPYWASRLVNQQAEGGEVLFDEFGGYSIVIGEPEYKPYTHVLFINGYRKDSPRIEKEIEGITIGKPKKGMCPDKWLDHEFFIIKFK